MSCICWISYGFFIKDINVVILNTIGLFLAIIQFYIYFFYKNKYPHLSKKSPTLSIENISSENNKNEERVIHINEKINKIIKEKPVKIITN